MGLEHFESWAHVGQACHGLLRYGDAVEALEKIVPWWSVELGLAPHLVLVDALVKLEMLEKAVEVGERMLHLVREAGFVGMRSSLAHVALSAPYAQLRYWDKILEYLERAGTGQWNGAPSESHIRLIRALRLGQAKADDYYTSEQRMCRKCGKVVTICGDPESDCRKFSCAQCANLRITGLPSVSWPTGHPKSRTVSLPVGQEVARHVFVSIQRCRTVVARRGSIAAASALLKTCGTCQTVTDESG